MARTATEAEIVAMARAAPVCAGRDERAGRVVRISAARLASMARRGVLVADAAPGGVVWYTVRHASAVPS